MAGTLPRTLLSRHPFHGSPERKPSGIPVAAVFDRGAVVSTGVPFRLSGGAPPLPSMFAPECRPPAINSDEIRHLSLPHHRCFTC